MLVQATPEDFVIATGTTHSVRDFCELAFGRLGLDYTRHVELDPRFERRADGQVLVGDPARARAELQWHARVPFSDLVAMMVDSDLAALQAADRGN
jgi:GDPmannose 4,6-dehydratase